MALPKGVNAAASFQNKMSFYSIKAIYHREQGEKPSRRDISGSTKRCRCGYDLPKQDEVLRSETLRMRDRDIELAV
ncbi:hypothetical protein [Shewanella woodyi]|uniref:Uncharacterized protein n=1 Tax=Shewanella woodyi (strain ATCC 51908 / MS32) TaxID=392500 RepID=B1KQ61_SHEWM|nr:hypothetical protein [Shewanella woodyi]ACA89174.1 hypothetical protein Swoo_4925 [Shewanella woodyi ATCC 51908]